MTDRTLGRTLWTLLLSLLNATLILLALCLFLGWKLAETASGMATEVTDRLAEFTPVRAELGDIADELKALRADLALARSDTGVRASAAQTQAITRIETLSDRFDVIAAKAETLVETPEALIDHAVAAAGTEARQTYQALRGCEPPAAPDA